MLITMKEIHYVSADEAVKAIKSGDHIHLSSVASVPHILVDALVRRAEAGEVRTCISTTSTPKGRLHIQIRNIQGSFLSRGSS